AVPSLPIAGLSEPLRVNIDFAADMVDAIIDRLTELRAQMLPMPTAATIECVYEFAPPNGKAAILVLGMGISCDDEWGPLKIPAEYSGRFGGHEMVQFTSWPLMISALAVTFCDGHRNAVLERLVNKFDERPTT